MTNIERATKLAAKPRPKPPNPSAEIVPFPASASTRPTGGAGRLPTEVIARLGLDTEQVFHVAYRSLHADGAGWGCHPRKMAAAVRSGYSRSVFQRTQRSLIEKGLIKREQGKRKGPGRGRGYAIDSLTFQNPEAAYVAIDRSLFDGSRTPKEIACFLHLKARGKRLAEPWHIEQLMQASRPTANDVLGALSEAGLITNYGTQNSPLWGVSGLKSPTFKKPTRTHPMGSSRQSFPHAYISQHKSEGKWAVGTRERVAFALLLYTGQRRSDVVAMTWQHIIDGRISVMPEKTKRSTRKRLRIRLHPQLAKALEEWPKRHISILTTTFGKPFSPAGFGSWMADRIAAAGLPDHCVTHGLRKGSRASPRRGWMPSTRDHGDHGPHEPERGAAIHRRGGSSAPGGCRHRKTNSEQRIPNLSPRFGKTAKNESRINVRF